MRMAYRLAVGALLLAASLWTVVAVGFAMQAWWRLPELSAWHRIAFEHEFDADRADAATSFPAYLEQEARLFDELKRRIYDDPGEASREPFDRFRPGSPVARLGPFMGGSGDFAANSLIARRL